MMEELPKKSGIYIIESKSKKRRYIGSSVNIKRRIWQHLKYLKDGNHFSKYLQNHYNKYGKNDINISILELCDKKELLEKENFYIKDLKPEFNTRLFATSNLGIKFTKEQCERISKALKGRKKSNKHLENISIARKKGIKNGTIKLPVFDRKGEANGNYRHGKSMIRLYKKDKTKTIQEWHNENLKKYGKKLPIDVCNKMSESKKGEKNPLFGKNHSEETIQKISYYAKNRTKEHNKSISMSKSKEIVQLTREGIYINTYLGQKSAAESIGISRAAIGHALLGINPTAGGFIWKYKTN